MNLPDFGETLGLSGAILQIIGYVAYIRSVTRNGVVPNFASWLLWSFGSIVTLAVYSGVTDDWSKLALPIVCAASSMLILFIVARGQDLRSLESIDWLIVAADVIVVLVWIAVPDPVWAYSALLIDTSLTFVPIIRAILAGRTSERPTPWIIWTAAYSCMLGVSLVKWEGVYPVLLPFMLLILHAITSYLSFRSFGMAHAAKSGHS